MRKDNSFNWEWKFEVNAIKITDKKNVNKVLLIWMDVIWAEKNEIRNRENNNDTIRRFIFLSVSDL